MVKRELELNEVISFILSSEPKIITLICTIGIAHIMNTKYGLKEVKEVCKEMDYFLEEIKIICHDPM